MRAAWQIHNLCRMEKQEPTPLKKLIRAFFWGNELKAFPLLKSAIFAFPHERHLKPTTATTTWNSKQKPKSAIFCFFSHSFSLKPWKLRGKIVSLHKKSCTWQIESKLSLRSFAFSLQKKSCTRQIESKLSLRSFAFSLPPNSLKKIFRLCKTWVKDNESVWSIFAYSVVCTSEAALGDNYY